jgi:prepilin-type N-terminal cleavage/methylation domain-containing protein
VTRGRGQRGLSLIEVVVAASLLALLMALAFPRWQGHQHQQRLRYGVAQVAAGLRQAQERAKAERTPYTVTFTLGSGSYPIVRSGGGFRENAELPAGVVATATQTVTFTAFGQPGAAYTVSLQNAAGTATVTVTATGGITYVEP